MGANGHVMRGVEGSCGAQVVRDLRGELHVVGLKAGEHQGL
jgi:hypothetical protein